jgi:hypothetical protein
MIMIKILWKILKNNLEKLVLTRLFKLPILQTHQKKTRTLKIITY